MELRARFGISERLDELVNNLSELDGARLNNQSEVKLYAERTATPLAVLPLAIYANYYKIAISLTEDSSDDVCSYLDAIAFPSGVTDLQSIEGYHLPIARRPANEDDPVLSKYRDMILSQITTADTNATNIERFKFSVNMMTAELVNNVLEHSLVDHYHVLAQYYHYATNKPCEIIIADNGIGYKASYEDSTKYHPKSHAEAIQNAIEGNSSKSRIDNAWDRGAGIPIIKNMFVNGINGKLVIMSGDAILYYKKGITKAKEILLPLSLVGSIVCVNFNVNKLKDVDPVQYLNVNR